MLPNQFPKFEIENLFCRSFQLLFFILFNKTDVWYTLDPKEEYKIDLNDNNSLRYYLD